MIDRQREQRVSDAFVAVADILVSDFDIIDLLQTLVEVSVTVLDVEAGGILLADDDGTLQLVASTSEQAKLVEVMQLSAGAGPCVDCFEAGQLVVVDDIAAQRDHWPRFSDEALSQGFASVFATPMRLRGEILGAMNLFRTRAGSPTTEDALLAQALTDVATIGILHERTIRDSTILAEQLQRALDTRVLIEQAKGVLAIVGPYTMDEAFTAMRDHARTHDLALRDVAQGVADRSLIGLFSISADHERRDTPR
ncbi:GAF domain-containing protein [Microcella putealis]|uniref:GAF domain-containing protein n=1 Tax=Microcella putealis TaxID=337005 RepID=A0A4Q7LWX3_9MICO|nr:GAF and ANTAR domain-containing protein [Microcella putealis]RZS58987.1 GAF domain-containing protein [Microcella putealis]TQM24013.1 GAF domain-containing protein [Microcella putealis]